MAGFLNTLNIGGTDYALSEGGLYGTCTTGASTAAKVVSDIANLTELVAGTTIRVKFTNSNTASSATLNVNSLGAKNLCCYGTTRVGTTTKTSWQAGAIVSLTYDGTSWVMNDYIADTGITTDTQNTAGSNQSASKLYLIGATSQTTGSNGVQTYSNSNVYEQSGMLHASAINGVDISSNGAEVTISEATGGYTSLTIPNGKDYTLGDACEKGVDTAITSGSTSTNLPTTAAVADYVDSAVAIASSGALTYKGTVTALTDITSTSYKTGWYWMVGSNPSITIDGVTCEPGDMIIAKQDKTATADNDLDVVQSNIEALTTAEIDTLWAAA